MVSSSVPSLEGRFELRYVARNDYLHLSNLMRTRCTDPFTSLESTKPVHGGVQYFRIPWQGNTSSYSQYTVGACGDRPQNGEGVLRAIVRDSRVRPSQDIVSPSSMPK